MKRAPKELSLVSKDDRFTPFEKSVYRVICSIPKGETRSYGWVARRLGRHGAARAVGNALNKNPYTVAIPCHRVINGDGSLGGYSKGVRVKKSLLTAEYLTKRE